MPTQTFARVSRRGSCSGIAPSCIARLIVPFLAGFSYFVRRNGDGNWLFVNAQSPGITFAITGDWAGGGGKQVRIRHAGGYESYYLHLSAFGPGIRAGVRVKQGQMIGRVGATGTATSAGG